MEQQAFEYLKSTEDSWWIHGRKDALAAGLRHAHVPRGALGLDAGAGYGAMGQFLRAYVGLVDAFEPEDAAREVAQKRGYRECAARLDGLSGTYDLVGAFDVIEHVEGDAAFVASLFERTASGGYLAVTVPAFQFLWSDHDVLHKHFRRYTARSLAALLSEAGYEVTYLRYWNIALFPVAVLLRLLGRGNGDALTPHPTVNRLLMTILKLEAALSPYIRVPFGVSVVAVARKPIS